MSPLGVGEALRASANVVGGDTTGLFVLPSLLFVSVFGCGSVVDSVEGSGGSCELTGWVVDAGLPFVPAAALAVARVFLVVLLGLVLGVSTDWVLSSISTSVEAATDGSE